MKKINYQNYLRSDHWRKKRRELFEKTGKFCHLCYAKKNLLVHHKNYKRLYNELLTDIIVICTRCHRKIHFRNKINKRTFSEASKIYNKLYRSMRAKIVYKPKFADRDSEECLRNKYNFNCKKRYSKHYY